MFTKNQRFLVGDREAAHNPCMSARKSLERRFTRIAFTVVCAVLFQVNESPGWTISSDRPDYADDVSTVPVGLLQVESGYSYSRALKEKQHTLGEWMLRTGLSGRSDIRLGLNSYLRDGSSGWGDGSLDFRFRLIKPEDDEKTGALSLTLLAGASLPTGSRQFSARRLQPAVMLTSALTLSGWVILAPFVNYSLQSSPEGQFSEFAAGSSFVFDLGNNLNWYAEGFVTTVESGFGRNTGSAGSGFLWLLRDNLQLDVHAITVLNGPSPDYSVGFGLSFFSSIK